MVTAAPSKPVFVRPRVAAVPDGDSDLGRQAVELYARFGSELDEWQAWTLERSMRTTDNGRWSAFEVGICGPRQNGKDEILLARELAGLFLEELGETLTLHSAHLFPTAREHQLRLVTLIESSEEYSRKVKRVYWANGAESIKLLDGRRILFVTRMKNSARGFAGVDLMVFNEAMILQEEARGAMMPTLSTRPNPQLWYAGSAVDQRVHEQGIVFARVRERGLAGDDPSLAFFEWSVETERKPDDLGDLAVDEAAWESANPSLGIRISHEHVANEQRSMAARTFAVERLGVGDWPRTDGLFGSLISPEQWADLLDENSTLIDPVCLAYDIAPDRSMAAIAAAGRNMEGLWHVEIIEHRRGTHWIGERFKHLIARHDPVWKGCDAYAALPELADDDVSVVGAAEHGIACGRFIDAVQDRAVRHKGSDELRSAVLAARTRPISDAAWAWSRKGSPVDITPLVAATVALSAAIDKVDNSDVRIW